MRQLTDFQAKYYAHELRRSYSYNSVGKLAGLLFDAQVEPKPHQIDAALFALKTPFLKGVILADEVGLGKTIEAGIVISQFWAERKRRILIVSPSSLRQQWQQELYEKFFLNTKILETKSLDNLVHDLSKQSPPICITSYEFVHRQEQNLCMQWDLVVCDEAHRLRNYWTGKNRSANAVASILKNTKKTILLTATPLQNRLEELYGLVSVFSPDYFHSLDAFREQYIRSRINNEGNDLVDRVAQISKRTLRKDAHKYIRFTSRLPITIEFTPSAEEQKLYELVNSYLQTESLYAFSSSQRHLTALIIRKRLGSSTYAVASTLEKIADRLEDELKNNMRRNNKGNLIYDAELTEDFDEDELGIFIDSEEESERQFGELDRKTLEGIKKEIQTLRDYAALAKSITVNQKALKLKDAIDQGFLRLKEIGAPQKAIIFTGSTKTQDYLANTLKELGLGEGLVLFNGTNNSPESLKIYREWLGKNKDSDLITGIPAADKRKALVDYFRDHGTLMLATEAASEGINLQFCSMIVNYDLPWNPQRVEQRIGRAHRYGQKHNVVVVNFSNKTNVAEQRILQLLTNKFHLFESVFGASDEILGSIEDGLDFEKTIALILNRCKTEEEINRAFEELEQKYAVEISSEMAKAKARVFDNLDPHVQDRLKNYEKESGELLNKFEKLLLSVTRHQLHNYANFEGDGRQFLLHTAPADEIHTGHYYFKSHPLENAHQYRFAGPLGNYVIDSAINAETPPQEMVFSLSQSERVSTIVKTLNGLSGELVVKLITFTMKSADNDISESYIVSGAISDDGQQFDHEVVADLMELHCQEIRPVTAQISQEKFIPLLNRTIKELEHEVKTRNTEYYNQQEEIAYRNLQDSKAIHEVKIRELRNKEKEARSKAKSSEDPMEELRLKREANSWNDKMEDEHDRWREENKRIRKEIDKYLSFVEHCLRGTQTVEDIFSIRWKVID